MKFIFYSGLVMTGGRWWQLVAGYGTALRSRGTVPCKPSQDASASCPSTTSSAAIIARAAFNCQPPKGWLAIGSSCMLRPPQGALQKTIRGDRPVQSTLVSLDNADWDFITCHNSS